MSIFTRISPAEFEQEVEKGVVVLDVRSKAEHDEFHLKTKHYLVPFSDLNPMDFLKSHNFDKNVPIVIVCHLGKRSQLAAEKFATEGCAHVSTVEGGLSACIAAGSAMEGNLPKETGAPTCKIRKFIHRLRKPRAVL